MAPETVSRNPPWTRDETIVALDVLVRNGMVQLSKHGSAVAELSRVLSAAPIHGPGSRENTFRNPSGVYRKLAHLRACEHGSVPGAVPTLAEIELVTEFRGQSELLARTALEIREAWGATPQQTTPNDNGDYPEGSRKWFAHNRLERSRSLRNSILKAERQKNSALVCAACSMRTPTASVTIGDSQFEVHHRVPLAQLGSRKTRASDVAVLCANCHRLVHAAIQARKAHVSVEELAVIVIANR